MPDWEGTITSSWGDNLKYPTQTVAGHTGDRRSALERLARQRCFQRECKAAVSMLLSLSNFFILCVPKADHPVQIQTEIPTPGIQPLLLKQFSMSLGYISSAQLPTRPLSLPPPTLLPLANREAIEKKAMDLQLPACPKMGSIVKDVTGRLCPSPVVLCIFPNDPAANDGNRLAGFAFNSNQLQKGVFYKEEIFLW